MVKIVMFQRDIYFITFMIFMATLISACKSVDSVINSLDCENKTCNVAVLNNWKIKDATTLKIFCNNKNFTTLPVCNKSVIFDNTNNNLKYDFILSNNLLQILNKNIMDNHFLHVSYLDFSNNYIEVIEENLFEKLENLISLNLQNNNMQILPNNFGFGKKFKELNLNSNPIKILERPIKGLSMVMLEMYNCSLEKISYDAFSELKNLERLVLAKNSLKSLTKNLFANLLKLTHLVLQYSTLPYENKEVIIDPDAFHSLNKLELIDLNGNKLKNVPQSMFKYNVNLKVLRIQNNEIVEIEDDSFASLENLEVLDLSNNNLTIIHKNLFKRNFNVNTLFLQDNKLSQLDNDAFKTLENLESLNLSNNSLKIIQDELFENNEKLKLLWINYNNLLNINTNAFKELVKLEELLLSHNKLSTLSSDLFESNENLQTLYLDNNQLAQVADSLLANTAQLKIITVGENPICSNLKGRNSRECANCMELINQLDENIKTDLDIDTIRRKCRGRPRPNPVRKPK